MIEEIFTKIRVEFLFAHPFLSVLALSLKHIYRECDYPITTDASTLYLDQKKLSNLKNEEIKYLYAHALLHIVLKHHSRLKNRDKKLWNRSCDIVTNIILSEFKDIGKPPVGEEPIPIFKGVTAEEVYERLLAQNEEGEQKDLREGEDNGEIKEFEEELDSLIIQALSLARLQNGFYGSLAVEISQIIKPDIRFDDVLKEYLCVSLFNKESSFTRPNRRFIHEGLYLPGHTKPPSHLSLYIAVDSSMSVDVELYRRFLGAVNEMVGSFEEYDITVIPFDDKVEGALVKKIESGEGLYEELFCIPKSDGGTDIAPVFEFIKEDMEGESKRLLAVLTDGFFYLPQNPPIETLFFVSEEQNLERFEGYGKSIRLGL